MEGASGARVRQRGSLWALALCCMRVLLRAEHPRRAFNHYQMSRRDLMQHLLLACKVLQRCIRPKPSHYIAYSRPLSRCYILRVSSPGSKVRFIIVSVQYYIIK